MLQNKKRVPPRNPLPLGKSPFSLKIIGGTSFLVLAREDRAPLASKKTSPLPYPLAFESFKALKEAQSF